MKSSFATAMANTTEKEKKKHQQQHQHQYPSNTQWIIFFFACLIQYVYLYATAIGSHTMQMCSCWDVRSSNQMKIMYYILRGFIFASKIPYAWNEIKIYTKNEQHQQQKHRRKRDKKTRKRISSHANFDMQVNKTRESHTRTYIGTFMTAK